MSSNVIVIEDSDDENDDTFNTSIQPENKRLSEMSKLSAKLKETLHEYNEKQNRPLDEWRTRLNPFVCDRTVKAKNDNNCPEASMDVSAHFLHTDSADEKLPADDDEKDGCGTGRTGCLQNKQKILKNCVGTIENNIFENQFDNELGEKEKCQKTDLLNSKEINDDISIQVHANTSTYQHSNYQPYYLRNFLLVLKTVLSDSHGKLLFNEEDQKVCQRFKDLSKEAQMLFIRLYQRKKQWLQFSKISYPNIGEDLTLWMNELVRHDFVTDKPCVSDLWEILSALSLKDTRTLATDFQITKSNSNKNKSDLILLLRKYCCKQKTIFSFTTSGSNGMKNTVLKKALSYLGKCLKLKEEVCFVFTRLFTYFTLSTWHYEDIMYHTGSNVLFNILQADIGNVIYADYTISKSTPIFLSRDKFIAYTQAHQLEIEVDLLLEKKDYDHAYKLYESCHRKFLLMMENLLVDDFAKTFLNRPYWLCCFTEEWITIRLFGKFVSLLEKRRDYKEAVVLIELLLSQTIFCKSSRGLLWERIALNCERHLKEKLKSYQYIIEALQDKHVRAGHRYNLVQRLKKQKTLTNLSIVVETLDNPRQVSLNAQMFLDTSSANRAVFRSPLGDTRLVQVEQFVLDYYHQEGFTCGVHGEGSAVTTLFIILFWEDIFMTLPDVFLNEYQRAPLDIYRDDFFSNRQIELSRRLQFIERVSEKELHALVKASWESHWNTACVGANWSLFENSQDIADLSVCIDRKVLLGICEMFCKDLRSRRGGFPDLLVWSVCQKKCKFIEVKGPGDKLSSKQVIWLNVLTCLGADASVCSVKGVGVKRRFLESEA